MNSDFHIPVGFTVDAPNFADYFGLWCIESETFTSLVNRYQGLNLHAHVNSATAAERTSRQNARDYQVTEDGVALFSIRGPMMKHVSSLSDGTSTIRARQQLRNGLKSNDVKGGILLMDTPGGTVRGNQDLADEVASFAASKPLYVFVEDMTASGGVSVASQATKRFANNDTALYGGMGTYAVLQDLSGRAEQLGVKVHVIRAGEFKGMGTAGTEITEAHLQEAQRIVNAMNENYLALIARGLNKPVEQIRAYADGRVHTAKDAVAMGLLDGVQTFEQTYSQLVAAINSKRPSFAASNRSVVMENKAATLAELKAAFPKSTADWRESQLEKGATLQDAAIAYASHVEEMAEKERSELTKQLEEARKSEPGNLTAIARNLGATLGHNPVQLRGKKFSAVQVEEDEEDDRQDYIESGDAIEDFNAAVAKIAGPRADLQRRQRAIRTVANRHPDLYEAYMLATNTGKRQTRLITEKLEAMRG